MIVAVSGMLWFPGRGDRAARCIPWPVRLLSGRAQMPEQTSSYTVQITRSPTQPGWVAVTMRKLWWSVSKGSKSRPIATAGFYAHNMSERDIVDGALRELLRTLADEMG